MSVFVEVFQDRKAENLKKVNYEYILDKISKNPFLQRRRTQPQLFIFVCLHDAIRMAMAKQRLDPPLFTIAPRPWLCQRVNHAISERRRHPHAARLQRSTANYRFL